MRGPGEACTDLPKIVDVESLSSEVGEARRYLSKRET